MRPVLIEVWSSRGPGERGPPPALGLRLSGKCHHTSKQGAFENGKDISYDWSRGLLSVTWRLVRSLETF